MVRQVGIYERGGKLFISPYHKTVAGYWVGDDANAIVDREDVVAVQNAVRSALAASRHGVPTPSRDCDLTRSLLLAAGVSSWNTFARSAKAVTVELTDGRIEITPDRNMGSRKGFVPLTDQMITVPQEDPNLGSAVLAALDLAH